MIDLISDILAQLFPIVVFGVCWWPCCGTDEPSPCDEGCLACLDDIPANMDVTFPALNNSTCTNCTTIGGSTQRLPYKDCAGPTGALCINVETWELANPGCSGHKMWVTVKWGTIFRSVTVSMGTTVDNGNNWVEYDGYVDVPPRFDCDAFSSMSLAYSSILSGASCSHPFPRLPVTVTAVP
jgi:hypothetical protein